MSAKTEHPLPSQGGSYSRDPETGELTPIVEADVEKPAPTQTPAKSTAKAKDA